MLDKIIDISVIMPVYEVNVAWLKASIDSILGQSFSSYEFIIVFDCPKNPQILELLSMYELNYPRIKLIRNKYNIGISSSINKAIDLAKGRYIVRMDADDIAVRYRLETQFEYMENNPQVSLSGGQVIKINSEGVTLGESSNPTQYNLIKRVAKYINPTTHPTWIVRKEVLLDVGKYRDMPSEDYDVLLRILDKEYVVTNLDDVLLLYRVHMKSHSVAHAHIQRVSFDYARKLHAERLKQGYDSYTESNMNNFIAGNELTNKNRIDPIYLLKSKVPLSKLKGATMLMISALTNRILRDYLICQSKARSTIFVEGLLS